MEDTTRPSPARRPYRWPKPETNFFRLPNEWTDIAAEISSLAELKVILYVLRHTWGYAEYDKPKHITADEFSLGRRRGDGTRLDKGTGLSEVSVRDGLKRAVADGLLVEQIDKTDLGRIKKSYYLHTANDDEIVDNSQDVEGKNLTPRRKELTPHPQDTYPRTEKDTSERNLKKYSDAPPNYERFVET